MVYNESKLIIRAINSFSLIKIEIISGWEILVGIEKQRLEITYFKIENFTSNVATPRILLNYRLC